MLCSGEGVYNTSLQIVAKQIGQKRNKKCELLELWKHDSRKRNVGWKNTHPIFFVATNLANWIERKNECELMMISETGRGIDGWTTASSKTGIFPLGCHCSVSTGFHGKDKTPQSQEQNWHHTVCCISTVQS
jgi:hypothetical protein